LINDFQVPWVEKGANKYPLYTVTVKFSSGEEAEVAEDYGAEEGNEEENQGTEEEEKESNDDDDEEAEVKEKESAKSESGSEKG
jgi:hypothetical protein